MNEGIDNKVFITYRARLALVGAQLHRTHVLDGAQRFFITGAGEVIEVTADGVAAVIADLETAKLSAITSAYRKGGGSRAVEYVEATVKCKSCDHAQVVRSASDAGNANGQRQHYFGSRYNFCDRCDGPVQQVGPLRPAGKPTSGGGNAKS